MHVRIYRTGSIRFSGPRARHMGLPILLRLLISRLPGKGPATAKANGPDRRQLLTARPPRKPESAVPHDRRISPQVGRPA
jgi:hypothetical protein